jgi:hypothetical protein
MKLLITPDKEINVERQIGVVNVKLSHKHETLHFYKYINLLFSKEKERFDGD